MDRVNFVNNEIAEVVDGNDLTNIPHEYTQEIVRAFANNEVTFLFNNLPPTGVIIAANDLSFTIPEQQFSVDGSVQTISSALETITNSSGGTRRYWLFFSLIETEVSDTRSIVNISTGVDTPTSTLVRKTESELFEFVETLTTDPMPSPSGVLLPEETRIGSILWGYFDFTSGGPATFTFNTSGLLTVAGAAAGIPAHAITHYDEGGSGTDIIPLSSDTNRGLMPKKATPYLTNAIANIEANSGEPFTVAIDQTNDFLGNVAFAIGTARRARLTLTTSVAFTKTGSTLGLNFGTPGVDTNKPARASDIPTGGTSAAYKTGYAVWDMTSSPTTLVIAHGLGVIPKSVRISFSRVINSSGTGRVWSGDGASNGTSLAAHNSSARCKQSTMVTAGGSTTAGRGDSGETGIIGGAVFDNKPSGTGGPHATFTALSSASMTFGYSGPVSAPSAGRYIDIIWEVSA